MHITVRREVKYSEVGRARENLHVSTVRSAIETLSFPTEEKAEGGLKGVDWGEEEGVPGVRILVGMPTDRADTSRSVAARLWLASLFDCLQV